VTDIAPLAQRGTFRYYLPMQDPIPDPKMSGRIAMIALLVAFGVVGMMLWIG